MKINRIFCWINTIYLSVKNFLLGNGLPVSGHIYQEQPESGKMRLVSIGKCQCCGKYSFAWS